MLESCRGPKKSKKKKEGEQNGMSRHATACDASKAMDGERQQVG